VPKIPALTGQISFARNEAYGNPGGVIAFGIIYASSRLGSLKEWKCLCAGGLSPF